MAELKPCPFCESTNISCADAGHKTDIWFVQCENCGATFPHFDSETEAVEAWNRRTEMPDADRCVCCGEIVPESRMVCPNCGAKMDGGNNNA